jgi:DNA helicase-2/ATP-dependent DNA helicase PcrA
LPGYEKPRWYEPILHETYDDAHFRAADIVQLEQIAAGYECRERFLTELTLDPPDATTGRSKTRKLDEDYTILSTIHSAKGQEWRIVRILNVVDGCIPSDIASGSSEEIEEERRLLYVAMTRAKDQLDLIVPQRFYSHQQARLGDRRVYACRSRFIPDSILENFDAHSWHGRVPRLATAPKKFGPGIDVAARLVGMWRQRGTG